MGRGRKKEREGVEGKTETERRPEGKQRRSTEPKDRPRRKESVIRQ